MFTKIIQKKQPVAPKNSQVAQYILQKQQKIKDLSGNLKGSSSHQQNFFLSLGGGDVPYSTSDPTLLWSYNIQSVVPGQKRRILQIANLTALLVNYQSPQFPLTLGLQIDGLVGLSYLKFTTPLGQGAPYWQTIPTDIATWTLARNITSSVNGVMTAYNVSYQIGEQQTWDVGMMNNLSIRLVDDKLNRIPGPFNNPVQLHLKIIHLGQ